MDRPKQKQYRKVVALIPYGQHEVVQEDIDAVVQVLQSDYLTQGPVVPQFEQAVAKYCFAKRGVATNSATSALHLACLALGLKKGDVLWTSPISFVASANCGLYCGASVDFVDIDKNTFNMCPIALEQKLQAAEKCGTLPKIVIPVHLCGESCDMKPIHALGKKYGFKIIEDASHAIGGRYKNNPVGCCEYSDITVFSFHPVKIMTTGEGGMAMANDEHLADTMELLRSHGITRDESLMTHESDGGWYYQQVGLGFNYRMTDIQGALGFNQLSRVDANVLRRHEIAGRYDEVFINTSITPQQQLQGTYSTYHLYIINFEAGITAQEHKQIYVSMRESGVGVNLHYIPIHTQPYFKVLGFNEGDFPIAEQYYNRALTLPLYPNLTPTNQASCIESLLQVSNL